MFRSTNCKYLLDLLFSGHESNWGSKNHKLSFFEALISMEILCEKYYFKLDLTKRLNHPNLQKSQKIFKIPHKTLFIDEDFVSLDCSQLALVRNLPYLMFFFKQMKLKYFYLTLPGIIWNHRKIVSRKLYKIISRGVAYA